MNRRARTMTKLEKETLNRLSFVSAVGIHTYSSTSGSTASQITSLPHSVTVHCPHAHTAAKRAPSHCRRHCHHHNPLPPNIASRSTPYLGIFHLRAVSRRSGQRCTDPAAPRDSPGNRPAKEGGLDGKTVSQPRSARAWQMSGVRGAWQARGADGVTFSGGCTDQMPNISGAINKAGNLHTSMREVLDMSS